jgi:CRISPR-associated protein Csd1
MSQPVSGLLPALVGYYQRLENDPNEGVAEYGFSVGKIHFQLVLEPDGSLFSFDDIRLRNDKGTPIPRPLLVADGGGRSGTGLKPFFGWDNTGYVLGRDNKGNPKRAEEMFAAFRELHKSFVTELASDDGFVALCRFLDGWKPERAETLPNWEEAAGLNIVFKLRAREGYIHQSDLVRAAWLRSITQQDPKEKPVLGVSLMNGMEEELARLHPQIKGVVGANTTGAAIVSFNLDAFESYGKSQSFNSPVGTRDAFRYTTALNRLLADDARRVRIGDATVVFWSDRPEGGDAEEIFRAMFGDDVPRSEEAEHTPTVARLKNFLDAARQLQLQDMVTDPDAPFYVLGLSPNASRLNVRYWLVGTVRQFAKRLAEHVERLEMTGAKPNDPPLVIRRLLLETVREAKDIAPQLAGEVARAVLGGFPYPQALFNAVVRRIRADSQMNHRRAAILKAHLIRNRKAEVPVALNKEHLDEAYQLGRLFAVLEFAQTNALGDLNRTVKDAYFSAAAASPASVFPRLLRLHHHHVEKLPTNPEAARREKKRTKGFFERLVQEICSHVGKFPHHLSLERQGLFYIAYFHQRQDFFTKRTDDKQETNDE